MSLPLAGDIGSVTTMSTTRAAAILRVSVKLVMTSGLLLLLCGSALASSSPDLHAWLHSDHQSPTHYCLATALEQGHTQLESVVVPLMPATMGASVTALPFESFFISHDIALHPERGPPVPF
jgi:hypothetical protein